MIVVPGGKYWDPVKSTTVQLVCVYYLLTMQLSKNMDWFARNHNNVCKWNDMFSYLKKLKYITMFVTFNTSVIKTKLTTSTFISKNVFQNALFI